VAQRCSARRADGSPCHNWSAGATGFCRWHQADMKEAQADQIERLARRLIAGWIVGQQCGGVATDLLDQLPEALQKEVSSSINHIRGAILRGDIPEDHPARPHLDLLLKRVFPKESHDNGAVGAAEPPAVPMKTFQEFRTALQAVGDGKDLYRWEPCSGELALLHVVDREPFQVKLCHGDWAAWWGYPETHKGLTEGLQVLEFSAVVLMVVCVGMASERDGYIHVTIDNLIRWIGWQPRSTAERAEMRSKVWRWLLIFDKMEVLGKRRGTYRDPHTRQVLNLNSRDALLKVVGRRDPEQQTLDNSQPPVEVSIVAGPWLQAFRGNRQVITDYGDVRRIAAIPSGKPSGAWAQAIGLAFMQRSRERSKNARETDEGIFIDRPHTRRDLLSLFRCAPYVEEVLGGNNPQRAKDIWNGAVAQLKEHGVIGYCEPLAPIPDVRRGWADAWLDQPLDIRAASLPALQATAEIARRAQSVRSRLRRKREKNG
jgi:hypothetical protein